MQVRSQAVGGVFARRSGTKALERIMRPLAQIVALMMRECSEGGRESVVRFRRGPSIYHVQMMDIRLSIWLALA